jgi:hypothetical protein
MAVPCLASLAAAASLLACDEPGPRCRDCAAEEAPQCNRLVCDAAAGRCETVALEDGSPCSDEESCSRGESCRAGECLPGEPIECDEPTGCQQVRCDPVADRCVLEDEPDGVPCATPCVVVGECSSGECAGQATDCSWLSGSCWEGLCHPETGECYLAPASGGTDCAAADPSCATAACDGAGACLEEPFPEGEPCDDHDACTVGEACESGLCTGLPVTSCAGGDGCCAEGCPDDRDCCEVAGPALAPDSWSYFGEALLDPSTGEVVLTPAMPSRLGQVWLAHELRGPFQARFRYRAPSGDDVADGLVLIFYKDRDYEPGSGGSLGFEERDCGEGRGISGYGIEVDNYRNPCDASGSHIAILEGPTASHLERVNDARAKDGAWHDVLVVVAESSISVELDGAPLLSWEGTIDRTFGGLALSAATGGLWAEYVVSDVELSCL